MLQKRPELPKATYTDDNIIQNAGQYSKTEDHDVLELIQRHITQFRSIPSQSLVVSNLQNHLKSNLTQFQFQNTELILNILINLNAKLNFRPSLDEKVPILIKTSILRLCQSLSDEISVQQVIAEAKNFCGLSFLTAQQDQYLAQMFNYLRRQKYKFNDVPRAPTVFTAKAFDMYQAVVFGTELTTFPRGYEELEAVLSIIPSKMVNYELEKEILNSVQQVRPLSKYNQFVLKNQEIISRDFKTEFVRILMFYPLEETENFLNEFYGQVKQLDLADEVSKYLETAK